MSQDELDRIWLDHVQGRDTPCYACGKTLDDGEPMILTSNPLGAWIKEEGTWKVIPVAGRAQP